MIPGVSSHSILGKYSPIVVIHNVSSSAQNSHYFIYTRARQGGCQSLSDEGHWLLYNDTSVSKCFNNLNAVNTSINNQDVYMVMYESYVIQSQVI
jgi:hypothetical protein